MIEYGIQLTWCTSSHCANTVSEVVQVVAVAVAATNNAAPAAGHLRLRFPGTETSLPVSEGDAPWAISLWNVEDGKPSVDKDSWTTLFSLQLGT